jgi:glucose/arabinose dehydrogenase
VPRARKSLDDKIAELTKRQEQLEAQRLSLLASKKAADRKLDTRRKIIVGAAVLAHADLHPDFSTKLREILSVAVQRDIDRRDIVDLLVRSPRNDPHHPEQQRAEP